MSKFYCWDCYDDQTAILTDNGWKFFEDVETNDGIYTLNSFNWQIEIQNFSIKIKRRSDTIVTYVGKSTNFGITPNHDIIYFTSCNHLKNKSIDELPIQVRLLSRIGNWIGDIDKQFELPAIKYFARRGISVQETKEEPIKYFNWMDWSHFMAAFLSEGCTSTGHQVILTQNDNSFLDDMKSIVNKMGYQYGKYHCGIRIVDKQLWNYLRQFGKAPQKFIPSYIKNAPPSTISVFLDWYCRGDGTYRKVKNGVMRLFYTSSKTMADDLQECIMKIGGSATIAFTPSRRKNWCDEYRISERTSEFRTFDSRKLCIEKYDGFVYDVTVPNHIIYVRRNGRPMWGSNCHKWLNEKELEICKKEHPNDIEEYPNNFDPKIGRIKK